MKKIILITALILLSIIKTSSGTISQLISEEQIELFTLQLEKDRIKRLAEGSLDEFLKHLGFKESSNNHLSINTYGYIGEYQFGKAALKETGYGHITVKEFKENPDIFNKDDQKDAVIKLMKINNKRLNRYIDKYEGRYINGIKITKSGLLAASHLAGPGNVIKFLKSAGDKDFSDAYGTNVSKYLKEFQNHNINLEYV